MSEHVQSIAKTWCNRAQESEKAEQVTLTTDSPENALKREFEELERRMVESGKFRAVTIEGKRTLLPCRPMVINISDDGYGFTSGGLS